MSLLTVGELDGTAIMLRSEGSIEKTAAISILPKGVLPESFPAKTFLLIAKCSERNPDVAAFSPDGSSFYVYDQAVFASQYLPQCFKHSNWGSFVRQLNLYGFASSRLKHNSDVVVWTHELFHRDRKESLGRIKIVKRARKSGVSQDKGAATAAEPHQRPELAPVFSSSDGGSTSLSSEGGSTDFHPPHFVRHHHSAVNGGPIDRVWMEAELNTLKQQNWTLERKADSLEQKVDLLLKITLQISPNGLEDIQSAQLDKLGKKRRRVASLPITAHAVQNLAPIHEDHKTERVTLYHERKAPCNVASEEKTCEYTQLIDTMLNGSDCDISDHKSKDQRLVRQPPADADHTNSISMTPTYNTNAAFGGTWRGGEHDDNEEDALEVAANGIADRAMDPNGMFHMPLEEFEDTEQEITTDTRRPYWSTLTNQNTDKAAGPDLLPSTPLNGLALVEDDLELEGEGARLQGAAYGVSIVAAEVFDIEGGNDAMREAALRREELARQQAEQILQDGRKHQRNVIFLLSFIGVAVVALGVAAVIAVPIIVSNNYTYRASSNVDNSTPGYRTFDNKYDEVYDEHDAEFYNADNDRRQRRVKEYFKPG